jgi:hypothetical protein
LSEDIQKAVYDKYTGLSSEAILANTKISYPTKSSRVFVIPPKEFDKLKGRNNVKGIVTGPTYETQVAFIPKGANSNTRLHEIGHVLDTTNTVGKGLPPPEVAALRELTAIEFQSQCKSKTEIAYDQIYNTAKFIMDDYQVTPRRAVRSLASALHKKGWHWNAHDSQQLVDALESRR